MSAQVRPPMLIKSPSRTGVPHGGVAEVPLLQIKGLKTHFKTDDGWLHAVDGVDLTIDRGETVWVVGESGCGKTVTAMTVLKLVPMPPGRIVAGEVLWKGRDLVTASNDEMRRVRAKEIAIIFQEPMTSLNPVYSVGEQIAESLRLHDGLSRKAAMERAVEMLALTRSRPCQSTSPAVILPGGIGRSFSTVIAVTVLPHPDSPTMHSVSPRST